jgi:hypothetical protein
LNCSKNKIPLIRFPNRIEEKNMKNDSTSAHRADQVRTIADSGREVYEAPAIEELGSMAELTRSDLSFEVI